MVSKDVTATTRRLPGSAFWLAALIAVPALNVGLVLLADSIDPNRDVSSIALLVILLIDAAILGWLAHRRGTHRAWAAVGVVLSAVVTAGVFYVAVLIALASCDGCLS